MTNCLFYALASYWRRKAKGNRGHHHTEEVDPDRTTARSGEMWNCRQPHAMATVMELYALSTGLSFTNSSIALSGWRALP